MLDVIYYTRENKSIDVKISDIIYEKLGTIGLDKIVDYLEYKVIVENDEYNINAVKLNYDNRLRLLSLLEKERQEELEKIFNSIDENPTIKEIREKFKYLKILTTLYKLFKDENNIYFSYE